MGPVRPNPIQRTVRTAYLSVLMTELVEITDASVCCQNQYTPQNPQYCNSSYRSNLKAFLSSCHNFMHKTTYRTLVYLVLTVTDNKHILWKRAKQSTLNSVCMSIAMHQYVYDPVYSRNWATFFVVRLTKHIKSNASSVEVSVDRLSNV